MKHINFDRWSSRSHENWWYVLVSQWLESDPRPWICPVGWDNSTLNSEIVSLYDCVIIFSMWICHWGYICTYILRIPHSKTHSWYVQQYVHQGDSPSCTHCDIRDQRISDQAKWSYKSVQILHHDLHMKNTTHSSGDGKARVKRKMAIVIGFIGTRSGSCGPPPWALGS